MSKQIEPQELARIVATLLVDPQSIGELEDQSTYMRFVQEIGALVGEFCGGQAGEVTVESPAARDGYLLPVYIDEALPDINNNVWSAFDLPGWDGESDSFAYPSAEEYEATLERFAQVVPGNLARDLRTAIKVVVRHGTLDARKALGDLAAEMFADPDLTYSGEPQPRGPRP